MLLAAIYITNVYNKIRKWCCWEKNVSISHLHRTVGQYILSQQTSLNECRHITSYFLYIRTQSVLLMKLSFPIQGGKPKCELRGLLLNTQQKISDYSILPQVVIYMLKSRHLCYYFSSCQDNICISCIR